LKALEPASQRLKTRLSELNFDFKKSLGQNFLVSDHVISKILEAAERIPFQALLEIGPGLGALTDGLRELSPAPRLLELDSRLCEYWRGQGLEVLEVDALRWKWESLSTEKDVLLVSNLPYQISSSLVIDRCLGPESLRWMILMFQKEVAQRITAPAGDGNYGLLSVMAQLHFDIQKVAEASPRDFQPAPKVASRVLKFTRKETPAVRGETLLRLLKQGFGQRRKKLVNNLKSLLAPSQGGKLEEWLQAETLSPQARAEELTPAQWLKLAKWLEHGN
jgi:16S rRNA (adenine1518-N6/adenine1519-N6)-dimethyltransferase